MKRTKTYEQLLIEYIEKFGESFPTYMAPQDEDEAMAIIEKCIRENKIYDPYEDGSDPEDIF